MNSFTRLHEESNKIGTEFLMTELDTAFTFLALSETTASAETRERNRKNALAAYNTILRMHGRIVMEANRKRDFQLKIKNLKKRLKDAGLEIP